MKPMNRYIQVLWWHPGQLDRRWRRHFTIRQTGRAASLAGHLRKRGRAVSVTLISRY